MRWWLSGVLAGALLLVPAVARAAIFGTVSGIVQDPQHRPVPQAQITVHAQLSSWEARATTDDQGRFSVATVPAGAYVVSAAKAGFETAEQSIVVRPDAVTSVTLALRLGGVSATVSVSAAPSSAETKQVTTASLVTRDELERTPGALRSNSLDFVTQFVPGAYVVHDQLHIRGGHQTTWLVDGVPVPNTNIASNVGPQFDPKDIDTIEIERGGYSADKGDRTFGVFNVVTRSGFERNREAELALTYGSFNETNDQFSLGDHANRLAYYASVNGNVTNLGLETPAPETIHDRGTGVGAFGSLVFQATPANQIRMVTSVRGDGYQIPNTPENAAAGIDDAQHERDGFVNVSWLHTIGSAAFLTVSPFYHYNRAAFDGGPLDPVRTIDERSSQYAGAQVVVAAMRGRHDVRVGGYGFAQLDDARFALQPLEGSGFDQRQRPTGHLAVAFAEDNITAADWMTLSVGLRATQFAGVASETALSPRLGGIVRLPAGLAVRAYYGRYYQPPPLTTVSGPLLDLAAEEGFGFVPLPGERDAQYEIGAGIPVRGWSIDLSAFHTSARDFFDHDVIGNSNIFVPVAIGQARIRGFEASVRSPRNRRAEAHLAFSHQYVQGRGGVTGGLLSFEPEPTAEGYFFLDHDQRDTVSAGASVQVDAATWLSASLAYGSGFLEGDGPAHEPAHVVFNLEASRRVAGRWTAYANALNVANTHFLLDDTNTFGGTHFNSPRQLMVGVRYRFRY